MFKAVQRIRVEWSHCDPARMIFNPHYYIWMDQGSHSLFEAAGFPFSEHAGTDGFWGCPLVASGMDFLKPVHFGDTVELTSGVASFGRKSFRVEHRFTCNDEPVAKGFEIRVWGRDDEDGSGRLTAVPVPQEIKDMLSKDATVDTTQK